MKGCELKVKVEITRSTYAAWAWRMRAGPIPAFPQRGKEKHGTSGNHIRLSMKSAECAYRISARSYQKYSKKTAKYRLSFKVIPH